jgi:uncharacterized LabA/DUF88 family protein
MARRLDSTAKVLVFVDGQNVYKTCERFYGHGYVHPLLLAHQVLDGRKLCGLRYYSGLHDPRIQPAMHAAIQRRHNLIRKLGGTVVERPLRYRWEWGFDAKSLPNPESHQGTTQQIDITPYQRAREKGIDLALGLDVVDLALRGAMDVAVIMSFDRDLCEVARVVHDMTRNQARVSVEAAIFNDFKQARLLPHYDYTHQLTRNDFQAAKDNFDYKQPIDPTIEQAYIQACQGHLPKP